MYYEKILSEQRLKQRKEEHAMSRKQPVQRPKVEVTVLWKGRKNVAGVWRIRGQPSRNKAKGAITQDPGGQGTKYECYSENSSKVLSRVRVCDGIRCVL